MPSINSFGQDGRLYFSDILQIPKCRTKLAQQSFSYRAVDIWNSYAQKYKADKLYYTLEKHQSSQF